jgi:hypothetical protein
MLAGFCNIFAGFVLCGVVGFLCRYLVDKKNVISKYKYLKVISYYGFLPLNFGVCLKNSRSLDYEICV